MLLRFGLRYPSSGASVGTYTVAVSPDSYPSSSALAALSVSKSRTSVPGYTFEAVYRSPSYVYSNVARGTYEVPLVERSSTAVDVTVPSTVVAESSADDCVL